MLPRRIAGDAAELHSGRDAVFIGHSGRLPWHRRRRDSRCGGRSGGSTDHSNSRRIHAQTPCDRRTDRIQCHSDGMCGFHVSSAHGGHVGVACGGCAAHIAAQKRSGPRIQQNGMLFADTSFHPCHMGRAADGTDGRHRPCGTGDSADCGSVSRRNRPRSA